MLDVTNLSSWVNNSEKRLWLGLVLLINLGKIIVPAISLPIKHNEIFVLTFSENLRRISDIILAIENLEKLRKFWQTIESNFTDKTLKDEKIFIVEGGKVITKKM